MSTPCPHDSSERGDFVGFRNWIHTENAACGAANPDVVDIFALANRDNEKEGSRPNPRPILRARDCTRG
jgi:hypothetical protein